MVVSSELVRLPDPTRKTAVSLEEALVRRRSVREYSSDQVARREAAQLLWAAQGISDQSGLRNAPSAGALYALELYLLDAFGLWRYLPKPNALECVLRRDLRAALASACPAPSPAARAPLVVVIAMVPRRLAPRFGVLAERLAVLEAGHVSQNILLQAAALGLGAVPLGVFDEAQASRVLNLAKHERPCCLIPVGHPAESWAGRKP